MSVASPIVAGAALVPVLWGLARGEQPGPLQIAGVAMTLVGIVLVSRGPSRDEGERRRADRTGILVAVGSAVTLGLFLVAMDYGGEAGPFWTVAVARTVAFCRDRTRGGRFRGRRCDLAAGRCRSWWWWDS